MRPMAIVALGELVLLVVVVVFLVRERRKVDRDRAAAEEGRRQLIAGHEQMTRDERAFWHAELSSALNRVAAPEAVALESLEAARPSRRTIRSEENEPSLGDVDREQLRRDLEATIKATDDHLRARGVDPSELQQESVLASGDHERPGS